MADQASGNIVSGWLKAGITSVLGLVSGAALMSLTPLVHNAVKPAKPVANFAFQTQGLMVTFQNRSQGGNQGWWDFGDGSALEPFSSSQDTVVHTYHRPGVYPAKLSLRNLLGEENERNVSVVLDGAAIPVPVIETFQVVPIRPDCTAPATFRILSKVKNAQTGVLALGDDRPLEFLADPAAAQDRLVTYKEPGYYTIKLVALNGKQTAEKSETVFVNLGETGQPTATLQVIYEAVQVERLERTYNVPVAFPPKCQENVFPFQVEQKAELGFEVRSARLGKLTEGRHFKAPPKVEIAADKTRAWLTGELVKPGNLWQRHAPPPAVGIPVTLWQEKRSPATLRPAEPMMANLTVPTSLLLPLPPLAANWELHKRQLILQVHEGKQLVWQDTKLPAQANLRLQNRPCRLTAVEVGNQVKIDLVRSNQ